ncbi:hypothetical protein DERF_004817 [Dermatophagoides farinae]|uniref:PDZ domain-containing protein n=1 Tax=Dermatophagoides farinae TaxID=6954 RepID=A0A922I5L0_DERFA|nr:hypothetical protein DERF_004817 [Dermatophagoides farinae]
MSTIPNDAPCPRLCHLIKWPDFNGYGFNLHAEKTKQGQYIGKVDDDSPALLAGLREGDKIIEVNFVNICNENHRQVVERIKSITNETRLLVIDDYGDRWYRERKMVIKSTQPNVVCYRTPVPRPDPGTLPLPLPSQDPMIQHRTTLMNNNLISNNKSVDHPEQQTDKNELNRRKSSSSSSSTSTTSLSKKQNNNAGCNQQNDGDIKSNGTIATSNGKNNGTIDSRTASITSSSSSDSSSSSSNSNHNNNNNKNRNSVTDSPISNRSHSNNSESNFNNNNNNNNNEIIAEEKKLSNGTSTTTTITTATTPQRIVSNQNGELNLNMTAAEMRQLIAQRKKQDVKSTQIDLRKKYEIIQQM